MIDALLYAVRDGIRAAKIGYGIAECEIMDDGQPPPRCGNFFLAIHDGAVRSTADNQLNELYDFSATMTMRVTVPMDRLGDQQIARNLIREQARKQGFYAKTDQIRALLHMNWDMVVVPNKTPPSANDNLVAWAGTKEVYGFCEPMRFRSMELPKPVFANWFNADPEDDSAIGVKATMSFKDCRRMQPVTAASGPFV